MPFNLIKALPEHGAKQLTLVANTTGSAQQPRMPDTGIVVKARQVRARSARCRADGRPRGQLPPVVALHGPRAASVVDQFNAARA
jgi:3-oxoadipate CoA-transferase alpha subunit